MTWLLRCTSENYLAIHWAKTWILAVTKLWNQMYFTWVHGPSDWTRNFILCSAHIACNFVLEKNPGAFYVLMDCRLTRKNYVHLLLFLTCFWSIKNEKRFLNWIWEIPKWFHSKSLIHRFLILHISYFVHGLDQLTIELETESTDTKSFTFIFLNKHYSPFNEMFLTISKTSLLLCMFSCFELNPPSEASGVR